MALQITSANFEALLKESKPLVVDFWATWCGPCQLIGPSIEELHNEMKDVANIGKCNVDEENDLPARFGIRNIPTILFFKNGEQVGKLVGAHPKDVIKKAIQDLL